MGRGKLIDLGLPSGTLWYSCNLGAEEPNECGKYFSWGNTFGEGLVDGKTVYSFDEDAYEKSDGYKVVGHIGEAHDVAGKILGEGFRIPSLKDFNELLDKRYTSIKWTDDYDKSGVKGRVVTSRVNGNSVFFPAAGFVSFNTQFDYNILGLYWSSDDCKDMMAYSFYFYKQNYYRDHEQPRKVGLNIRPVSDRKG